MVTVHADGPLVILDLVGPRRDYILLSSDATENLVVTLRQHADWAEATAQALIVAGQSWPKLNEEWAATVDIYYSNIVIRLNRVTDRVPLSVLVARQLAKLLVDAVNNARHQLQLILVGGC